MKIIWIICITFLLSNCGENSMDSSADVNEKKHLYKSQISTEFPFFGAGNASYFEYLGLTIYFATDLDEKMQKKILQRVPEDFNADLDDYNGRFLNLYMEYGYDGMTSIYHENFDVLNTHIEKALLEIHKIAPIVFAYRSEDTEAAGTKFSQWHRNSEKQLENVVKKLESGLVHLAEKEVHTLRKSLIEIYDLYGKEPHNEIRFKSKEWNPKISLSHFKNIIETINKAKDEYAVRSILFDIYDNNLQREDTFYRISKEAKNKYLQECLESYYYLPYIINYAKKINDTATISYYKNNPKIIVKTFSHFPKDEEKLTNFIDAYFPLLPKYSKDIDTSIFVNIMYRLIRENFGFKIDNDRNHMVLDKALPYGQDNPTIFYNASCMYSEMNETDKAFDCINKTLEYNLTRSSLLHLHKELQIQTGDESFSNLRKDKRYISFMKDFELKLKEKFKRPKGVHKDANVTEY